ncbi:MAG TPA: ABC transporter ATP-binding protein [Roseiflexaceae bacterium]|nr:ABC transporter ATP-binding protein [Roseiflexaceae bacterium]
MGFIMDGLDAEAYDRSYSDRELIRRILGYFQPHTMRMVLVALMLVLLSIVATIIPILIARAVDMLAGNPELQLVVGIAAIVTVLGALTWGFNFIRQIYSARAVGDVVLALRRDAFRAVTQRDMSFYDQFPSGKIVSRVTSDTQDFATVVTLTIDLISQLMLVVIISVVMLVVNVELALMTLAVAPLVIGAALLFRQAARRTTQRAQRALASVNSSIQETISGIAVAKSFRQEAAIYGQFRDTNALAYRVRLRQALVFGSIFPFLNTVSGITIAAVVYFGGVRALSGVISVGDWYLFVQSLAIFFFPLTSVASFWSQFQQGLSASERVFALIDAEPRVVQHAAEPVGAIHGDIRFDQVYFTYDRDALTIGGAGAPPLPAGAQWLLSGFSLDIPAGQTLAIVGHTGAGKSSLMRLITRFYEFQGGRILVDGRDLRMLDLAQYRRKLGLVPQVPFLFSGTVAENIRYGRPGASDAEILSAAQRLGDEWIADLPEGLATDVGERGARLSLGQRQLVALARVLLQDPAIFLLDEATASIDPFTEAQIQDGLDVVMGGRTSIIIAHRLSTVRNADRIIVMKQGRMIEEGTHDSLLVQGGHYAELYNTYFRHQSLDYKPWEGVTRGT